MAKQPIYGYWVGIPITTLQSKEWRNLQSTSRCVYIAMLMRYYRRGEEADGYVNWTQEELAEATGLSLRTVKTCTKELKEKEWITVWNLGGRWARGTTYAVNPLYANGQGPRTT